MRLAMLGTGGALVTNCYNTCFALTENGEAFLTDCGGGNGILRQLERASIDVRSMRQVFITHRHLDHFTGALWLMRMIAYLMRHGRYEGDAFFYGHDEVIELLRRISMSLIDAKESRFIGERIHLVPLADGEEFVVLGHRAVCFDIHSTKARQSGYSLFYADGKKLTCLGDEPYRECERKYAEGSEWLLHEAFCLWEDRERFRPYEKHHSTARDAAEAAERLGVKNLILYHTEDDDLPHRKERYTKEGLKYFSGSLFVPDDLESFEL